MPAVREPSRWLILAVLFIVRTVMGFQFQSIASISSFLVDSLIIDYAAVGTLIGLYLLPGVIFALPGGFLGKRFGDTRVVVAGLAMMAAGGVLVGVSQDYSTAIMGRTLSGVGAVLLNVLLTKMVADWFAGREIITAMAVLVNSWPFGIALGLVTQGWLAESFSWPLVQHLAAAASVVALVLVVTLYRRPASVSAEGDAPQALERLSGREILFASLAGLVWCLFNVGLIVVISFAPTLLQANGLPVARAAVLVSLGTWLGIATIPVGGYIAERLRAPNAVMTVCFLAACLAVLWMPSAAWPLAPFLAFGIFAWAPAGPIMALPADVLQTQNRGPGMGVYFTWYYAGMGVMPALAGLTYDLSGNPAAPLYFGAAAMFSCVPLLLLFRVLGRRKAIPEASS